MLNIPKITLEDWLGNFDSMIKIIDNQNQLLSYLIDLYLKKINNELRIESKIKTTKNLINYLIRLIKYKTITERTIYEMFLENEVYIDYSDNLIQTLEELLLIDDYSILLKTYKYFVRLKRDYMHLSIDKAKDLSILLKKKFKDKH